ncbi:MAG: hypothetical protein K9L23_12995, partial [Desulfotignum sp.]|nr:hypothetical protein [Desulfotignum sp.]
DALKTAFRSDEAVKLIKQLLPQTGSLAENIDKINQTAGMDKALVMADTRVDVFQKFANGINAVKIGLGQGLLPVLTPTIEKLAQGAGKIYEWTQQFPTLTKYIGIAIAAIAGGSGVIGAFAAMSGLARLAAFGLGKQSIFAKTAMLVFRLVVKATTLTMVFFKNAGLVAGKVAMMAWRLAVKAATVTMSVFRFAGLVAGKAAMLAWNLAVKATTAIMALFRGGLVAGRTAMLAMNAAMYANPVGLVVAGVLLLTAGVAAAIYYWDDLKAAFMDSAWGQAIMGVVDKVLGSLKSLWEMITKLFDKITSISGAWGWIKGKIPGLGDDTDLAPASSPALNAPRQGAAATGGVSKMISNAVNTDNRRTESRSVHIGQVVTSRPINPQEIGNQLWLAGS